MDGPSWSPPPNQIQWYLDVNGKKVGPFSQDQLAGLLRDGEILPTQKVTADHIGGHWVDVTEVAHPDGPTLSGFRAPPRPPEHKPEPGHKPIGDDPALGLFDTLQAAKEKSANAPARPLGTPEETRWEKAAS